MKATTISVIALAMTTATGLAIAQDDAANEPYSNQPEVATARLDNFAPMTRSERLRHYLTGTFGRKALARNAMHAEFGQLTKFPKEWGSDGRGFATRVGSGFGQHFIRKTLEYGASSICMKTIVTCGRARRASSSGPAMPSQARS